MATDRRGREALHAGKEPKDFMERVVYNNLGRPSARVVVKPGMGLDNGAVSLGGGRVLITTTDPVSVVPAFGMKLSAWLSVHLIASDYSTSGNDPGFATFTYNFPPEMTTGQKEEYLKEIGRSCRRLGVSIVGGHTGSYPGAGLTVVGSGTMFGIAREGAYVTPVMAQEGDVILMTKRAAIEATGSLALIFPEFAAKTLGTKAARSAQASIRDCTVVDDARGARRAGLGEDGVTSMHDATEGGVLGALAEMAAAARKSFVVGEDLIPVSGESAALCSSFGLDPLSTMGEGALLITCRPGVAAEVRRNVNRVGVPIAEIGAVGRGSGLTLTGRGRRKYAAKPDKYWRAYDMAVEKGLT